MKESDDDALHDGRLVGARGRRRVRVGAAARDGMRGVRVAVRVSPRPVLAGNRELALQALVVGSQLPVGNGPVGAHAVAAFDLEVGGVEAGRVAGVVGH